MEAAALRAARLGVSSIYTRPTTYFVYTILSVAYLAAGRQEPDAQPTWPYIGRRLLRRSLLLASSAYSSA
jgi:hypothetical protein